MAKLTRANYDAIRNHLFDRIHKNGEQMKNDFPNILRTAIREEVLKKFTGFDGKPFQNLVEWLHYEFPNGVAMGRGQHVITYEDALQLTEGATDVHSVLLENAPKGKPGPKPKNGNELGVSTLPIMQRGKNRNYSSSVLSVRLFQEKPKFYEAYQRGKYKSVTAAAIAAGLLKDNADMRRAQSAFRQMTASEQNELIKWQAKNR